MRKRILALLLCLLLLTGIALPARAEEAEAQEEPETTALSIRTIEEFLEFAENCRLDSYSQNLAVTLEADIDLSGTEFTSIPVFSGTFEGSGHTISGINMTAEGSTLGLFRYLTATAVVQNLSVSGEFHPGGSRSQIGAIAGQNAGQILNCHFSGSISGGDYVGGLVGTNAVTGILEQCTAEGDIHGDHFVGGIAGENRGVIRSCTNSALVNTTPQQNSVEISDITMDTLTNTEAVNTVTDIGGITGSSSGLLRNCTNRGDVGYQHMGYNIGGIAGTQSGYIADCENHGSVHGRKEVGGIVGQMEPASLIEYAEDTLQILQGQLGTMSGLVNQASSNAQTNASQVATQISDLQDQTQTAKDAVKALFPDKEDPSLPDPDAILAAQNTLTSTLNAMPGTLQSITSGVQDTVSGLTRDLGALSAQISAMGQTINGASETLGGSITDISDQDTDETLTGKAERCINYGSVLADLNAGGIVGAMAMENDLDILEDWEQYGEESLNFQSEVRAVVLDCENRGTITGKKQNVGGIAGWQALGLVKNCTNTGKLDSADADNVGGISGLSAGYIRNGQSKCEILGKRCVGGIAGSGTIVTDCISMVQIQSGSEKLGAVLGEAAKGSAQTEEEPISGNLYPALAQDMGAIDGISYAGIAEPVTLEAFLAREDLPELFRSVTVRFLFADGTQEEVTVPTGGALSADQIPELPQEDGCSARWAGLAEEDLEYIVSDMLFEAEYTAHKTTIQSQETRNGLPILLAQGAFTTDSAICIMELTEDLPQEEDLLIREGYTVEVTNGTATSLRYLPEEAEALESIGILVRGADGQWRSAQPTVDGRYLVFDLQEGDSAFCLVENTANPMAHWLPIAAAGVTLLVCILILCKVRRNRKEKKTQQAK